MPIGARPRTSIAIVAKWNSRQNQEIATVGSQADPQKKPRPPLVLALIADKAQQIDSETELLLHDAANKTMPRNCPSSLKTDFPRAVLKT